MIFHSRHVQTRCMSRCWCAGEEWRCIYCDTATAIDTRVQRQGNFYFFLQNANHYQSSYLSNFSCFHSSCVSNKQWPCCRRRRRRQELFFNCKYLLQLAKTSTLPFDKYNYYDYDVVVGIVFRTICNDKLNMRIARTQWVYNFIVCL